VQLQTSIENQLGLQKKTEIIP